MNNNFALNFIPNPFAYIPSGLSIQERLKDPTTQRITQLALPFFNLYQPLALGLTVGNGLCKTWVHLSCVYEHVKQREWQKGSKELIFLVLTIVSTAASIFHFRLGLIVALSVELCTDLQKIIQCFQKKNYQEAALASLQMMQHGLYLASAVLPNPLYGIACMAGQIAVEALRSVKAFQQAHYLEGIAYLILCGIRGYRLKPEFEAFMQSIGGPHEPSQRLDKKQTKRLLKELQKYRSDHPEEKIKFSEFLKNQNYLTHLTGVDFSKAVNRCQTLNSDVLSHVDFSDVSFTDCQFYSLALNQSQFARSNLENCNFEYGALRQGIFRHVQIVRANFKGTNLDETEFYYVQIKDSNLKWARFDQASFSYVQFHHLKLSSTYGNKAQFQNCHFFDCTGEDANFDSAKFSQTFFERTDIEKSDFIDAQFQNCQFDRVSFEDTNCLRSRWQECAIRSSRLNDSILMQAELNDISFDNSRLDYVNFYQAQLDHLTIQKCHLTGTCFLGAHATSSTVRECDLTDSLFYETSRSLSFENCSENRITRPIIGLPTNMSERGVTVPQVYQAIKESQAIPVRLHNMMPSVETEKLEKELQLAIQEAHLAKNLPDFYSIPHEVLTHAQEGSQIAKIKTQAHDLMNHVDGIVIPGGADIEPEFYGQVREPTTDIVKDGGQRTTFEFALFLEADQRKCPIKGICRGAQVGAVYHGGTLKQDVQGQYERQEYRVDGGILKKLVGNKITGLSMHHQAIVDPGPHLIPTIRHGEIIKALEHPNGHTYLFQFHIEYAHGLDYTAGISSNNAYIFPYLGKLAENYQQKRNESKITHKSADAA